MYVYVCNICIYVYPRRPPLSSAEMAPAEDTDTQQAPRIIIIIIIIIIVIIRCVIHNIMFSSSSSSSSSSSNNDNSSGSSSSSSSSSSSMPAGGGEAPPKRSCRVADKGSLALTLMRWQCCKGRMESLLCKRAYNKHKHNTTTLNKALAIPAAPPQPAPRLGPHRRNRNPRPQSQKFGKLVFLIVVSPSRLRLNSLSGAPVWGRGFPTLSVGGALKDSEIDDWADNVDEARLRPCVLASIYIYIYICIWVYTHTYTYTIIV